MEKFEFEIVNMISDEPKTFENWKSKCTLAEFSRKNTTGIDSLFFCGEDGKHDHFQN